MPQSDLKIRTSAKKGFAWSFFENISLHATRFFIGIIMARLLTPADYGMVGMLIVFMVFSDILINSGIGAALNHMQNRIKEDFSTAFIFNVAIGLATYIILFLLSPLIADFYGVPLLSPLLKVIALSLIINACGIIPITILQIELKFKQISIITIISSLLSGLSGLYFAYSGLGVWALVYSVILGNTLKCLLFFVASRWYPETGFSFNSLKKMFSMGGKLMMSQIIECIYSNIYPFIIGKRYNPAAVGFYTRGQAYANLPSSVMTSMIYRVCFPVFCKENNDKAALLKSYERMMLGISLFVIPILVLLIILAKPLVVIFIADKWLPCVPILKILCLCYLWTPINEVNTSLMKALGQSGKILKAQFVSKCVAVVILLISLQFNIIIMCWGAVCISIITLLISFHYSYEDTGITVLQQIKFIRIPMLGGCVMYLVGQIVYSQIDAPILQILICTPISLLIFMIISQICGIKFCRYINFKISTRS